MVSQVESETRAAHGGGAHGGAAPAQAGAPAKADGSALLGGAVAAAPSGDACAAEAWSATGSGRSTPTSFASEAPPALASKRVTLMYFERCAPERGATVVLRGGSTEQASRITHFSHSPPTHVTPPPFLLHVSQRPLACFPAAQAAQAAPGVGGLCRE